MESNVKKIYYKFNAKRKVFDAKQADLQDMKELKQLEGKIKNVKAT